MGSVDEAVQAALDVKAKIAVPFHYGLYEGTEKDADAFVAALQAKGVQALRLPKK
jgi:L-ascorbate metabolism protein UlaG (beta-lactamase superfamily)